MNTKNNNIREVYNLIRNNYYKEIEIPNFNPDDYISIDHFLKIISVMYLKNDRHFNAYKPIYYTEVPLGCVNSHNQGYLYIPRTDYYMSKETCYRFIECAHRAISQLKIRNIRDYVIDLRCNSGGLILLFIGCLCSFIKTRGVLGTGIDSKGNEKYKYFLTDNEFYAANGNDKFASLKIKPKHITDKVQKKDEEIFNSNTKIKPDIHTRQLKSMIINDYVPDMEDYDGMSITYPLIEFDNITVLVDHGSGSASEYITSILKAEGARVCGYKTIGIVTQNISITHNDVHIVMPTCLFKNKNNETFPDGVTPEIEGIPDQYLPK